nr:capsid protein [Cressdnaviricota sp.]
MNTVSQQSYNPYYGSNLRGSPSVNTYSGRRTLYGKYKPKRKFKQTKLVKNIKQIVKYEQIKNSDIKDLSLAPATILLRSYAGTNWTTTHGIQLSPGYNLSITQGTDQQSRVGNHIKPVKAKFNFVVTPAIYDATFNPNPQPLILQMWFYRIKSQPTVNPISVNPGTGIFNRGNTTQALAGTTVDLLQPLNTDDYHWYGYKEYKIGFATFGGTGTAAGQQAFTNNDFKYCTKQTIDFLKWLPKDISFSDNAGSPATSNSVNVIFQVVYASGNNMGAAVTPANMVWSIDFSWVDI